MIAQDGGRDGSSAVLDGPAKEHPRDPMLARAMTCRITRKAARRRPPTAAQKKMMPAVRLETSAIVGMANWRERELAPLSDILGLAASRCPSVPAAASLTPPCCE